MDRIVTCIRQQLSHPLLERLVDEGGGQPPRSASACSISSRIAGSSIVGGTW
jgi:hypothetical protein